jgi:hypothetical protein
MKKGNFLLLCNMRRSILLYVESKSPYGKSDRSVADPVDP